MAARLFCEGIHKVYMYTYSRLELLLLLPPLNFPREMLLLLLPSNSPSPQPNERSPPSRLSTFSLKKMQQPPNGFTYIQGVPSGWHFKMHIKLENSYIWHLKCMLFGHPEFHKVGILSVAKPSKVGKEEQ